MTITMNPGTYLNLFEFLNFYKYNLSQKKQMNQDSSKQNQKKISPKQAPELASRAENRVSFNNKKKTILENEINHEYAMGTIAEYSSRLFVEEKLVHSFEEQVQSKTYIFDKIIPFQTNQIEQQSRVSHFIPSESFLIFSPHFLDGIGQYLEIHQQYTQERKNYEELGSLQRNMNCSRVVQKIQPYSDREEQFFTAFLLKYRTDENIKQLLESLLKIQYYYFKDMAQDPMIRQHTEGSIKSQYSSLYELYLHGNEEMKKYLIRKIIGKDSLGARYHHFYETSSIILTYCIKYEDNYIALLKVFKLNEVEYSKKLESERLIRDLKQKGYKEIIYVYTLFVLPIYKRKGHGKLILNALKKEEVPIVLCSSATPELSGVPDNIGNGYFYRKCGLQEYFPLKIKQDDELDRVCINQSSQHKNCDIKHCINPLKAYPDQSYYVYYP